MGVYLRNFNHGVSRSFTTLLVLMLFFSGCQADTTNPEFSLEGAKVAVYINTWQSWKAATVKGQYLSDIILAFALINQNNLSIQMNGFSGWKEVAALQTAYPHLKVTVSVGGASEKGFPNVSADSDKRAAFIASICQFVKSHNLDGVDIDWEFPNSSQRVNYIALLRETRAALDVLESETGKQYSLSSAVSATYNASMAEAAEIVDSLKVMNYDYYGSWSGTTGHNANLYNNPRKQNEQSTDKSISAYLNAGIPAEKIMLGAAFYGKSWNGVSPGSYEPGLFQSYSTYGTEPSWTTIKTYLKDGSGYTRYWDDAAMAPFLYNAVSKRWVSYSDAEQMQCLARYAKEKKLGGVFAWEYLHDPGAELLIALAENAH